MPASPVTADSIWLDRLAEGGGFCCRLGVGAGQALEAFWRDVFSTARPGARVLEIGCGSGDVSAWATEARRGLQVIASDIHDRPEVVRLRPGMAFLGNARAESLPVASMSIDLVVSNFAFEYTPSLPQAVRELVRVLRPGGAAAMVAHSKDSAITADSRRLLQTYRTLVGTDVPGRIRRAAALGANDPSRRKLLEDVLERRADVEGGELYFEIADRLLRDDPTARQDYQVLEDKVARAMEVLEAQIRAALDEPALSGLKRQFAGQGMEVFSTEITGDYGAQQILKFGWLVFLNKPG
jgi:ubiquinone/menaquinone biosynthesis C-methylase UbiE